MVKNAGIDKFMQKNDIKVKQGIFLSLHSASYTYILSIMLFTSAWLFTFYCHWTAASVALPIQTNLQFLKKIWKRI